MKLGSPKAMAETGSLHVSEVLIEKLHGRIISASESTGGAALVFVHGGPGFAQSNYIDTFFQKLIDKRVFQHVVTWDQRGCGRSFRWLDLFKKQTMQGALLFCVD
jgi:pimeloyl-ACP methyl ester carboxylesterase